MPPDAPALALPANLRLAPASTPMSRVVAEPAEAASAGGTEAFGGIPMSSFQRALMEYQREQEPVDPKKSKKKKRKKGRYPQGSSQASVPQQTKKARPVWRRVVSWLVAIALLGGLGFAGMYVYTTYIRPPELPTFGSQPQYGSLSVRIVQTTAEGRLVLLVTSDRSGALADIVVEEGTDLVGSGHMIVTDMFAYLEADGAWYRTPAAAESVALAKSLTSVTFEQWVPQELRPHTVVRSADSVDVGGVEMQRYGLVLDFGAFAKASPAAHAEYMARMGTPAESRQSSVRVVLTVDGTGLVHRIETWSDVSPSERVEVTLISVSPDLPAIQVPTVFQDMATGQQIG